MKRKKKVSKKKSLSPSVPDRPNQQQALNSMKPQKTSHMNNQPVSFDLRQDYTGLLSVGIGLRGTLVCSLRMPYHKALKEVGNIKARFMRTESLNSIPDIFRSHISDDKMSKLGDRIKVESIKKDNIDK